MTRTQIVENRSQIAIYLPSLRGGGAEKVMVTLANGFAAYGYGVELVLARAEGPYLADVSDKVRIIDLNASRVFFSLPALVRYLRRERPRALLSALNHANVIAVAARALARSATRLVVSEHNNLTIAARAERSAAGRAVHAAMRWTYLRADGVVAVSAGVADDLARWAALPRARIEVIYNPVVTPALVARAAESPAHPWFGDGGPPVVIGVGRLTVQKDFATLMRAFALLRADRPSRLVILGEGGERAALAALVAELGLQDAVALPGFVDNPYAWMRGAALFVLSSAWEGLPTVLIEAMACGTPVVSTDCPSGPAEILEGGRWGRLVPAGDAAALASAMAAALDETAPPAVAVRAADFSAERALEAYLRVLGVAA